MVSHFLAWLFAATVSAGAALPDEDAAAVLRTMIVHRAAFGEACVVPAIGSTALDEERERFDRDREMAREGEGREPTAQEWRDELRRLYSDYWVSPASVDKISDEPVKLDPAEGKAIGVAAEALLSGKRKPPLLRRISSAWLVSPLRMRADRDRCPTLSFSAPAIFGDTAFVEVGLVRAPLNGSGHLYVLRRRFAGWIIVACRRTWVS
jgi:hypothetical protein